MDPLFAKLALAFAIVGAVAGLSLRPAAGDAAAGPVAAAAAATATQPPPALEEFWLLPIRVRDGRPVGGVQRLSVRQGEQVSIGIFPNAVELVQVEGYGVVADARPEAPAMIELRADIPGRFRISGPGGRLLGELDVRPFFVG